MKPVILFACIHNGGRSLAAKVLSERYSGGEVEIRSAGSEPGLSLNPVVVAVLAEMGISTEGEKPSLLTSALVEESDVVITMGCGETCPIFPGKRYEDWQVLDPKDQELDVVRGIIREIDERVQKLLREMGLEIID